ncbi:hypothetical protein L1049_021432 [Liquidambar formosana]|uniref:Uncharacterized protein n=1 Tax=Liquidambar formosana TaxID=63359 RepID=A0AAP0R2T6_LIQFO
MHEHPLKLKFHDCVRDICGDHVEGLIYECPICKFNVHPIASICKPPNSRAFLAARACIG